MTNIKENLKQSDVHSHIELAFVIIDQHLPSPYVEKVLAELPEPKPSKGYIRNVRYKINDCHLNRVDIVNALLAVSKKNEAEKIKLKESVA